MSRFISVVLSLVMFMCISPNVKAINSNSNLEDYESFGVQFIEDFFCKVNSNDYYDCTEICVNSDMSQYINKKHDILANRIVLAGYAVDSTKVSAIPIKITQNNNIATIIYEVTVTTQYTTLDVPSVEIKNVRLKILNNNGSLFLSDYYEYDYFDSVFCNTKNENTKNSNNTLELEISQPTYLINFSNETSKKLDIIKTIEKENYNKNISFSKSQKNELQISPMLAVNSTGNWNRTAMVSYARTNYCKNPPISGNSNLASYYDMSTISGNYDCTNFVSHCLLAGGAVENKTSLSAGWYYDTLANKSYSWAGVNQLYSFLVTNKGRGPQAQEISFQNFQPYYNVNWLSGDIIQIKYLSGGYAYPNFGHSTIVTGSSCNQYNLYEPQITCRSSSNYYSQKCDMPLSLAYPLGSVASAYRLIHITNIGY